MWFTGLFVSTERFNETTGAPVNQPDPLQG